MDAITGRGWTVSTVSPGTIADVPQRAAQALVAEPHTAKQPPVSYAAALQDPSLAALDPAAIPVPADILQALKSAQTVLLIGHIGPDGDCVGSTLATARALEALGKKIDVCVDDHLPGFLRAVDTEQRIKRAGQLGGKQWDLAMMMDVGVPSRIGGAVRLLKDAQTVAVVDHHQDVPQARDFFLRPEQPFLRWLEPNFPAAALQTGAILARLRGDFAAADPRHVYFPALVGMITDTNWGQIRGLLPGTHGYFKHLLATSTWRFGDMQQALAFKIPQRLKPFVFGGELPYDQLAPALAERARADMQAGQGVRIETFSVPTWRSGPAVLTVGCSPRHFQTLLEIGKLDDPQFASDDLWLIFKELRDQRRGTIPLAAAIREYADGSSLSLRAESGDGALRLARSLGGGGHKRAASGFASGLTLQQAKDMLVRWTAANSPWLDVGAAPV